MLYFLCGKGIACMVDMPDFVGAIWSDVHKLFIKSFCFVSVSKADLVPKRMLLFCCVCGFWLDSFSMVPHREVWIVFVINFVKMLFPGICLVLMYLFVYVIVKSNDL